MPPRNWIMRIEDILDASRWIQNHTHGLNLDAFVTNRMATHAVLHNMGVIGEAARHVQHEVQARYPDVPWDKMRGMRNVVIHEYDSVDLEIIWDTATNDIPLVVPRLLEILAQERPPET